MNRTVSNAVALRGGAKAVVHVHQQKIRKGEPSVIVRRRGKSHHFSRVEIAGPSVMIHSPVPDACGARVWIETHADVVGTVEDVPFCKRGAA
jgi:hypothetical protein